VAVACGLRLGPVRPGALKPDPRDCPKYPDNTQSKFYWASCNATDQIQPNGITVSFPNGTANYPINVAYPIVITANSVNAQGNTINTLLADVDLWSWGGWLGCDWHEIPTFGLLNNINGCAIGGNCPLVGKNLVVKTSVDLSSFASIVKLLTNGGVYRIDIHILNNDTGVKPAPEIACIRVEGVLQTS